MARKISWYIMTILVVAVALYAVINIIMPSYRLGLVQNLFLKFPSLTIIHLLGAAMAIIIGMFQFNSSFRVKYFSLHKSLGSVYVIAILFSGITGLILVFSLTGEPLVRSGFALMSFLGLGTTINGYLMISQGNVKSHRKWMIRSYAISLAGLIFGLCLFLSVVLEVKFEETYSTLAWICWVPNLLIVELYFWFQVQKIGMLVKPGRTSS